MGQGVSIALRPSEAIVQPLSASPDAELAADEAGRSWTATPPPLPEDLEQDLAGADLTGRDLRRLPLRGKDLSRADLRGATLDEADLRDVDLAGAKLAGASLLGARLDGADLTGADLTGADLTGATLDGATLDRAILERTCLKEASARNSHWGTTAAADGDWSGVQLQGARLVGAEWSALDLSGAGLQGASIRDSDLARCDLSRVVATELKAMDSTFAEVVLTGADLTGAVVQFANMDGVALAGAILDGARFEAVAFRAADFSVRSAQGATVERCSGLKLSAIDRLAEAGADVSPPLTIRVLRGLRARPRLSLALVGVLVAAVVGAAIPRTGGRQDRREPPPESDEEVLVGVDEATQKRWLELMEAYEQAPATRPATLLQLAEVLEQQGSVDDAEERLREAIGLVQLHPEQAPPTDARLQLARFLLRQGEVDESFDLAREGISAARTEGDRALGFLVLAEVRMAQDDAAGAAADLTSLVEHLATRPLALPGLRVDAASLLQKLERPEQALELLVLPDDASVAARTRVEMARGGLLARLGRTAEAERVFAGLERLDDPLVAGVAQAARTELVEQAADLGAERARLEERVAGGGEGGGEAALELARLDMRAGEVEAATSRLQAAARDFADHPAVVVTASRELAQLRASAGDVSSAVALLRGADRAATTDEQRVDVREQLAALYSDEGEFAQARMVLGRTLKDLDDPSYQARAQLYLAGIEDQAGRVDQALTLYRQVAGSEGSDAVMVAGARFGEATLLRRLGRSKEALPLMDQVLAELPPDEVLRGEAAVERAELLVELGQATDTELERMLASARAAGFDRAQPGAYAELLLIRARLLLAAGSAEDARALFARVRQMPSGVDDPGRIQLAVEGEVKALVQLGRQGEADRLLDSMGPAELTDGDAEDRCGAAASLARGRATAADIDGAAEAWSKLLGDCRSGRFLMIELPVMADALVGGGQSKRAVELLTAVVTNGSSPVGTQAAQLELGRLGDDGALLGASAGPDPALAALATVERAARLAEAGRLAEAEPLWTAVADSAATEPVPRSLALLGLGRLAALRGEAMAARGFWEEAKLVAPEDWIRAEAEGRLSTLAAPATTTDADP